MKSKKNNWIVGILSVILTAAGLFYTIYLTDEKSDQSIIAQTSGPTSTQIGTVGGNVTIVNQPTSKQTATRKLSQVFKQDTIGSTVSYIENIIGPAKYIYESDSTIDRDYIVDGCNFSLITEDDGRIFGIKLEISDKCTFDWEDVMHNYSYLHPPHLLRFGDIMTDLGGWTFKVGCLSRCGNAADPRSELRFGASRADGWLMAILTAKHVSSDNINAASALRNKLVGTMGEDFVEFGRYACNFDLNSAAIGVVDNMKVDSVTIRPIITGAVPGVGDPEIGENFVCR